MIDSMLYRAILPAGTYAAGEIIDLALFDGPAVVRDGYGPAILKKIFTVSDNGAPAGGYVTVKNQNWVDEMANILSSSSGNSAFGILSQDGPAIQKGGDLSLDPNSAFIVQYVNPVAVTTTADFDIFCQIDIDYPQVAAIANPEQEKGTPMSIVRTDSLSVAAFGTAATWTTYSVDQFKAGYRYLLAQVGANAHSGTSTNFNILFLKIHGTAQQNGLAQIIPIIPRLSGTNRFHLDYSVPMVKGPMLLSYLGFATAAATDAVTIEFDYIRR